MATVIKPNGEKVQVKNLAWLIRHQSQVTSVELAPQGQFGDPKPNFESRMIATLADGTRFITDWASRTVCIGWMAKRKAFKKIQADRWGFRDMWIIKETA